MKNKRGFTLIELIVVMVIIGILVLLATPRFIKYIKMARYTNIINDIRTVETVSLPIITRDNQLPKGTEETPVADFSKEIRERRLYGKDGYITENEEDIFKPEVGRVSETYGKDLGKYYLLDREGFLKPETRTRLKGDFYINWNGDVIYVDNKKSDKLVPGGESSNSGEDNDKTPDVTEEESSLSELFLYDQTNPGVIVGINMESPLWEKQERRENPDFNPDHICSDECLLDDSYIYNKDNMDTKDGRKFFSYVETLMVYKEKHIKETTEYIYKLPEIPSRRLVKSANGEETIVDIEKIQDGAFIKDLFYGDFNAPNLKEVGKLAFFASRLDGRFNAPKLEIADNASFIFSEFTGNIQAENLVNASSFSFMSSRFTGELNTPKLEFVGSGAFSESGFTGKLDLPRLIHVGDNGFYSSEFSGEFKGRNIQSIGSHAFSGSKFTGSLDGENLIIIDSFAFETSSFTEDFNAPNLRMLLDEAFRDSKFIGGINSPKLSLFGSDVFKNSDFKGEINVPVNIDINSGYDGDAVAIFIEIYNEDGSHIDKYFEYYGVNK